MARRKSIPAATSKRSRNRATSVIRLIMVALAVVCSLIAIHCSSVLLKSTAEVARNQELKISTPAVIELTSRHQPEASTGNTPQQNGKTVSKNCLGLGLGNGMDYLLSKYKQVFVEMPAKAAGTAFKEFTKDCMASTNSGSFAQIDNILNRKQYMKQAFKSKLKMPSLVTSHVYDPSAQPLYDTMIHATEETLIIYSYREETSRLISAIKEVVMTRNCKKEGECQMQEGKLLELLQHKSDEIGMGITENLRCKTYEVIKDNNPNLVFIHYKKASQLQKLLAKHHCPEVTQEVRANAAASRDVNVSIVMEGQSNKGTLVSLEDWLDAKRQMLALVFELRKDASCQATTKDIQYELMACPDKTLQVSGRSFENHKVRFPF